MRGGRDRDASVLVAAPAVRAVASAARMSGRDPLTDAQLDALLKRQMDRPEVVRVDAQTPLTVLRAERGDAIWPALSGFCGVVIGAIVTILVLVLLG